MKGQKFLSSLKNAMGTVMLLAGAFFVCSTVLSIRTVFADPIAPVNMDVYGVQSGRASARTSGRASPRGANSATSRATVARTAVANGRVNATPVRNVNSRTVASRTTSPRANATSSRNVVSREANVINRANQARNVRARTAVANGVSTAAGARVSLAGSAVRGNKGTTSTNYSYLTNKLYTGNYSNIIDSTTGLISDDAYQVCMESYYTCMDEICTARNAAQRRCACAGRVKAFADAEAQLETANEELIKVSGELALLIANKGKDVSVAFQLTDAEKVMNCVSWKDTTNQYGVNSQEAIDWCSNHGIFNNGKTVTSCAKPEYCSEAGNDFGFDVSTLDGTGSDILATLKSWADAKDNTITILQDDKEGLLGAFEGISNVVGSVSGISGAFADAEDLEDTLAETWGYDLFAHAHNEVCSRVLDSCFNGIYEACGSPSSFGGKCANGQSSNCPFNYNSKIEVSKAGDITLNERGATVTTNSSATCFGYTSASGDPYSSLRGPVADARRSIMNKYLLDANADCDAYGEQLRITAQNIGYQKVAAQQALQQKRLEFDNEEKETVLAQAIEAMGNFDECISEIMDCYETQARSNDNWTDARIKTYCAQIANVPHCYEEMICNPSMAQFRAVIDVADSGSCKNSQDYTQNTCRNVVTLNEIINGFGNSVEADYIAAEGTGSSIAMREQCLMDAGIDAVRNWSAFEEAADRVRCSVAELNNVNAKQGWKRSADKECTEITVCKDGYELKGGKCEVSDSSADDDDNTPGNDDNPSGSTGGGGKKVTCCANQVEYNNQCYYKTRSCAPMPANAKSGTQTFENGAYSDCVISECNNGYTLDSNLCHASKKDCDTKGEGVSKGYQEYNKNTGYYGACIITECVDGYELQNNSCVKQQSEREACVDAGGEWEADSSTCICYEPDGDIYGFKPAEWNPKTLKCECDSGFDKLGNECHPATEDACTDLGGSWIEDEEGGDSHYCEI